MQYKALTKGVDGVRKLYPANTIFSDIIPMEEKEKDWYGSIFTYSQEHFDNYQQTRSLAGIKDVKTKELVWDLDDKSNPENARKDAIELCSRLCRLGINSNDISIAFSGNKGFSISVYTDTFFTPEEFRNINIALAKDLITNDTSICDAQRIFRVIGTKHNKSGLYKYPLSLNSLSEETIEDIKNRAKDMETVTDGVYSGNRVVLPKAILDMKEKTLVPKDDIIFVNNIGELDFKFKPKGFQNCKFAIMNGFFPNGHRNDSLMVLAATCKANGFPKEVAYGICKAASLIQAKRYNTEPHSKKEIWLNIIETVFKPTWDGGQYTCKKEGWLKDLCQSLGAYKCTHSEQDATFVEVSDMFNTFEDYSLNIEKNTIKTGIAAFDDNVQITIGMPVALLGAPSAGKTSLSLNILNNTSKSGLNSVFFSMDMYSPLVYQKQIQKEFGYTSARIHDIFKHDKKQAIIINEKIKEEYKNVRFSLKAGQNVKDMRDLISSHEQTTGEKVKLVLIDYLECISGPYSDATANSAKIAGELRDFATETNTCVLTLVQPPKSAGDASQPLLSMRQIKGSSMLEQSFRVILGVYREGFGPKYGQKWDKFITVNALKNTMGSLFTVDNKWNGLKGTIEPLDDVGMDEINRLRQMLKDEKDKVNDGGWG